MDSSEFCNLLKHNNEDCKVYMSGLLLQGYSNAVGTFIRYFYDITLFRSQFSQEMLKDQRLSSFFIAQEIYLH